MRIGYAPYSPDLSRPGDRRRFPFYAKRRGLPFELADPREEFDLVILTPRTDLNSWSRYRPGKAKVVFDLVDSYLDVPRADPKALLRGPAKFLAREARHPFFSYRRAMERLLERADAATCATPEQAATMAPFCSNAHPIIDFQSDLVRRVKDDYGVTSPINLVWEGLAENIRGFSEVSRALARISRRQALLLHVIAPVEYREFAQRFWRRRTDRLAARYFDDVRIHPWQEERVSEIAVGCDLAVVPLSLGDPLARGKSENKLVSFWQMGLPTVTSATPAYARIMRSAGQDLFCASDDQWVQALERLIADEGERARAARTGRAFAEEHYSEERLLEAWDRVLAGL